MAHYEALLIEAHHEFSKQNCIRQLSNTGDMLYNAMEELINLLVCFTQEEGDLNLPLAMLVYLSATIFPPS